MPLSRRVIHQGQTKLLTGFAGYSIWYDNPNKETLATNLVVVEAKRESCTDSAMAQLAACMGIVHTTCKEESKENCVVYGASSDGRTFRFCRIDNAGVFVRSGLLEWRFPAQRENLFNHSVPPPSSSTFITDTDKGSYGTHSVAHNVL
jgi:hypothetical protein